MNLRIELPDNLEKVLRERAQLAGLPVESFVLQVVQERLAEAQPAQKTVSADEFSKWLHDWASRFPSLAQPIDDSRESIYAGRGE